MADGDGTQSGADGTQSGTGETTTAATGTTTETGTGSTTQSGGETSNTANADLERRAAEAESLRERMKAADARAAKFENELRQIRDKDMPAAEKMQRDLAESQQQVQKLQDTNRDLMVKVAFLEDNTYAWHDARAAQRLVDLSRVELADDGTVNGMKDALKALATAHPYLLKTEIKTESAPPGTAPANNGNSGGNKPKTGSLPGRFPVMRTRYKPQQ